MKHKRQLSVLAAIAFAMPAIGCVSNARASGLSTNQLIRLGLTRSQIAQLQSVRASGRSYYITEFNTVSCARHDDCEAIGFTMRLSEGTPEKTLTSFAEHWDGTKWSSQKLIIPGSITQLSSISCYAPGSCIAVGDYSRNDRALPLIERWNGVRWSQVAIAAPKSKKTDAYLDSVSCVSDGRCTATGMISSDNFRHDSGYEMRFDGSKWTHSTAPMSVAAGVVSCPEANDCFSASQSGSILRQQGGRWRTQRIRTPKHAAHTTSYLDFNSLSCGSVDDCVATGNFSEFSKRGRHFTFYSMPVIEHYNGVGWSRMLLPKVLYNPSSWSQPAVSCSSFGHCVVTGFGLPKGFATLTLRAGAWHVAAVTDVPQQAISCPDYNYCVAVIEDTDVSDSAHATKQPLASIFNSRRWRTVNVPIPRFRL